MKNQEYARGVDALNLIFIKRFEFPEPVFRPDDLVGGLLRSSPLGKRFKNQGCRFLSDSDKINKIINKMKRYKIKESWELKPIKNPRSSDDHFWQPFVCESKSINLTTRKKLPFYPFQVIVGDEIDINKKKLEDHAQFEISDYEINIQARLFPPGAGTVHFHLYLKPDILDLDNIIPLFDPKNILIKYKNNEMNVYKFFDNFIDSLVGNLVKTRQQRYMPRDVKGLYTVVNFQGGSLPINQYLIPLSKILAGKSNLSEREVEFYKNKLIDNKLKGRYEEDLFVVSNRVAILYVDQGIKKIHSKILKGRRCARNHFINAIELAYVTDCLLQEYTKYFEEILQQIDSHRIDKSFRAKVNELLTTKILDPCAYSTLMYSIRTVPQNLNNIPWTKDIYNQAFIEFDIGSKIGDTLKVTETLFKIAEDRNVQVDAMRTIYTEIKDWADKLIPLFGKK